MKKRLLLLVAVALLSAVNLFAGKYYRYEDIKRIQKNYKCSQDVLFEVNNKYGNVSMELWDKDEVQINIDITAKANSEREVNRILEMVSVSFQASHSKVSAITELENNFRVSNASFSIYYRVLVPRRASMDLTNKYGNVSVSRCNGSFTSDVKYGNLTIGQLMSSNVKMISKYGNINIDGGDAGDANIDIAYGKVKIGRLKSLNITSRYGGLRADRIDNLYVSAKYDDYEIESCSSINISEGGYTNFKINDLKTSFIAAPDVVRYGKVRLGGISSNLREITLKCAYTDVAITFTDRSNYDLDIATTYGNVKIGENVKGQFGNLSTISNERSTSRVKTNSGSGRRINIENRYANVNLN